MDIAIKNGSQGPFIQFSLGVEMSQSCLERFYERMRRTDGAELEYQRGRPEGSRLQDRSNSAQVLTLASRHLTSVFRGECQLQGSV